MKILLVDDEPDFLEQARIFLKNRGNGLSVETASSGDDALEMVKDNSYDAIVSDYRMQEMDGLELLKRIRENDIDTLFYILTGRGNGKTSKRALGLGASGYFHKSPDSNEKFDRLYEILVKSIERRQKVSGYLFAWIIINTGWGEVKYEKFERALNELSEIMGFEISEIEKKKVTSEKENIMAYTEHYWERPKEEPVEAKKWKEIVTDEPEVIDAGFRTRKIQQYKTKGRRSKEKEKVEKKAEERIENLLQKAESLKKSGLLSSPDKERELKNLLDRAIEAYEFRDYERSLKLGRKTEEYIGSKT